MWEITIIHVGGTISQYLTVALKFIKTRVILDPSILVICLLNTNLSIYETSIKTHHGKSIKNEII